jgi:ABC-type nitrate/sulfonate/bicarbonate transport system ATPase subunit
MLLSNLSAYYGPRNLQSSQRLAIVHAENRQGEILVYDESNGHWLDAITREEVGALDTVHGQKIMLIQSLHQSNN